MTATLTDRYVHAATRWLPGRLRSEVDAELRERIGDTVTARGGSATAERETLEELGDPLRVAVDYTGRQPALIGPRLFFPWLRLTTLLLAIVVPIVVGIDVVTGVIDGESVGAVVTSGLGSLVDVTVHVAFWVTLVFAVLDWTGTKADFDTWSVDRLPEPNPATSLSELIGGLVMLPILAGLVIWQDVRSPFVEDGERIAMADPDLWSWYLPLVIAVLALEVAHLLWVHRTGWTWAAAHANATISLLFTVPTVALLANDALVNPALVSHLGWDPQITHDVMIWSAVVVAVIGAWEIVDGYRRARLARQ